MSARHTGQWADAFRPRWPHSPLAPACRYLRLPVAIEPVGSSVAIDTFDQIFWHGTFDGSYTRPGDYLVASGQVFFIASQEPLQPIVCVRTNRTVSIARSAQVPVTSSGAYGGYSSSNATAFLSEYPAAVLIENKMSSSTAGLPTDQAIPYWSVLLPAHGAVEISSGDFISDDLGRSAVVSSSDRSGMGWRLVAKMAST